ncbi:hypothetical protein Misp03_07610 [Microbispora sp. NBRC 16548]|nr:hypothetical protein Misp03_07610 [Microbispora sp. NBRC 16548]
MLCVPFAGKAIVMMCSTSRSYAAVFRRPSARGALPPRGIRLLHHDPDPHVRAMAAELVGLWVHDHPDALAALIRSRDDDPSPAVRKKAGWYAPGGPIHRRTAPKPVRGS